MKDKWLDELGECLKDCKMNPSDRLWSELEKDLPAVRPRWTGWRKAAAVAAVVVVGGGAGIYYLQRSQPVSSVSPKIVAAFSKVMEEVRSSSLLVSKQLSNNTFSSASEPPVRRLLADQPSAAIQVDTVSTLRADTVAAVRTMSLMAAAESPGQETTTSSETKEKTEEWYERVPHTRKIHEEAVKTSSNEKWSFALVATNGLPSIGGSVGGNAHGGVSNVRYASEVLSPLEGQTAVPSLMAVSSAKYSERKTSVKHKVPVSYGLMVRKSVTRRVGVEAGVSYTVLGSNITETLGSSSLSYNQDVHYLDIPVRVNCSLYHKRWVSFYATAGGVVGKCVYAKQTDAENLSTPLNEKPWQFSLTASAGAQLNVHEHLGVYVEPGVGYYFDNHSSLRTVYQDHPWVFKLNFGVRVMY